MQFFVCSLPDSLDRLNYGCSDIWHCEGDYKMSVWKQKAKSIVLLLGRICSKIFFGWFDWLMSHSLVTDTFLLHLAFCFMFMCKNDVHLAKSTSALESSHLSQCGLMSCFLWIWLLLLNAVSSAQTYAFYKTSQCFCKHMMFILLPR